MIEPSKINARAKKYERENLKFRSFLKGHADPDELDGHFLDLHNELFPSYDCCRCANCCKAYNASLEEEELAAIASFLGMTPEDCENKYLTRTDEGFAIKAPCCFLQPNGECRIQECKPVECREFPYTNKPGRMHSLLGVVEFAEQCPVVFEIVQRLKKIYRFR